MMNVLTPFLMKRNEESLFEGLVTVIELAESLPRVFRPILNDLLTFCVTITKDASFEDRTRQTALEVLLTLAEASPAMIRKIDGFCPRVIPLALDMMADLEDEGITEIGKDKLDNVGEFGFHNFHTSFANGRDRHQSSMTFLPLP